MEEKEGQTAPGLDGWMEKLSSAQRNPRATYRLQFGPAFTFRDAKALVPYLQDLGISDVYASPLFKPCFEDSHGYDVCDHNQLNPAMGTPQEFDSLCTSLQRRGMGIILDLVPNHMGIGGAQNSRWMDVLENGPSSPYSCYFDIDWEPAKPELKNKVLLPILEDQYGKVLESGKLQLAFEDGAFFIYYYAHKLPIAPRSYSMILTHTLGGLAQTLEKDNEHLQELQSILTALNYLPPRTELNLEKLEERRREKEVIKRRLSTLCQKSEEVKLAIDSSVQTFNGAVGEPGSFDLLDALLADQAYRPAFWRVASDEINYRRFFDINHLAAIRMELPEVFRDTHQLIFRLLREKKVTGLRIDHPDGLWKPRDYFRHLQATYVGQQMENFWPPAEGQNSGSHREEIEAAVEDWFKERIRQKETSVGGWPLFVVAEKILGEEEPLPGDWAVCGTTGYEFLNVLNGIFVQGDNEKALERIYSLFIKRSINFADLVNSSKKMIMLVSLSSEIYALSHHLERIAEKNRLYRDFTLNGLTFAIREVIACLPVYRTYITGPGEVAPRDQVYIEAGVEEAKRRNPRTAEEIFDFIRDTLLFRNIQNFPEEDRGRLVEFVLKFQQITGPVMAKGLEDTAFYVFNRLISLNEVGGHPGRFGISVAKFHQRNAKRLQNWPHSLLATSTHDNKRSEDVRARIDVLSEIPKEWEDLVNRWSRWNVSRKTLVDGQPAPDPNDEYLLYQTIIGAWPMESMSPETFGLFRDRIAHYMNKATLEAKVHTNWINPNEEYDAAVRTFVYGVLDGLWGKGVHDDLRFLRNRFDLRAQLKALGPEGLKLSQLRKLFPYLLDRLRKKGFPQEWRAFQRWVACFGQFNSLAQVLLKLTSPGGPDIYQGTEVWDLSLVDPDNRRPVDYQRRRALLDDLKAQVNRAGRDLIPLVRELLGTSQDGRIKLYLIYRTLNFRRTRRELFLSGTYLPLEVTGGKKDHVCAFARIFGDESVLVATPRLVVGLTDGLEQPPLGAGIWKDTRLLLPSETAGQIYQNLFTGETLSAEERDGKSGLVLATVFSHFPVALLERIAQ